MYCGSITLRINGEKLDLENISKQLNMEPRYACHSGSKYYDKYEKSEKLYSEDIWLFSMDMTDDESIDCAINKFVDLFIRFSDFLAQQESVTIWISLYPETEQFNIHVSKCSISKLCKLGIDFDIEIAHLQTIYDGTYERMIDKKNEWPGG